MLEKILTTIGCALILACFGFAWHDWHSGFHEEWDRISKCESEVISEYEGMNLDWMEFWTPQQLHNYCAKETAK
tara:strand:+ start:152 stop:373 length:222 start_codon:yes stop_codon:yes gene_type:complete